MCNIHNASTDALSTKFLVTFGKNNVQAVEEMCVLFSILALTFQIKLWASAGLLLRCIKLL